MKHFLLLFLLILVQFGFGQDTLYFNSGEIHAVKIIEFDEHTNLMGYVYEQDTMYASISSFKHVVYSGDPNNQGVYSEIAKHQDSEKAREAIIQKIKLNPKYIYGKWAISTNLTSIWSAKSLLKYSRNSVYSVEPEYYVQDHFSIKMPISFGTPTTDLEYYPDPYRMSSMNDTDVLPSVSSLASRNRQKGHSRDLLFQIGLNPKFYFRGQRTFSWYIGQGVYLGQINLFRTDYYYTFEKYITPTYSAWDRPSIIYNSFDEKRWVFHYEGAIGLAINAFKNIGLTAEVGYTTVIKKANEGVDQVFIREIGGEYQLDPSKVQHAANYNSGQTLLPYFRVHLTYRFGGVKNEFK